MAFEDWDSPLGTPLCPGTFEGVRRPSKGSGLVCARSHLVTPNTAPPISGFCYIAGSLFYDAVKGAQVLSRDGVPCVMLGTIQLWGAPWLIRAMSAAPNCDSRRGTSAVS